MLFFTDGTLVFFLFRLSRLFRLFSNIEYHFCYEPTNQSTTSTSSAVTPKIIFSQLINAYEYSLLAQNSIIGMRLLLQRLLQESH